MLNQLKSHRPFQHLATLNQVEHFKLEVHTSGCNIADDSNLQYS